ncbi:hypothetical protein ABW19_dt0209124 [Dactylella cylindrospora]|nr:hypothetical protein ABW19_dt0209124 [Dactylella cylindrospora]
MSPRYTGDLPDPRAALERMPYRLYRVHRPAISGTEYFHNLGFEAGTTDHVNVFDSSELESSLSNHLNWRSKEPSPYISMFVGRENAEAWATHIMQKRPGYSTYIVEIDPSQIRTPVLRVQYAVSLLRERGSCIKANKNSIAKEYVALYKIPSEAVEKVELMTEGSRLFAVRKKSLEKSMHEDELDDDYE